MGKGISKLGWLIFIVAAIGAICRTGPDDPITASMKASGAYEPAMTVLAILIGLVVLALIWQFRKCLHASRKLEQLKTKRMR